MTEIERLRTLEHLAAEVARNLHRIAEELSQRRLPDETTLRHLADVLLAHVGDEVRQTQRVLR
jgi:hypothetical protein